MSPFGDLPDRIQVIPQEVVRASWITVPGSAVTQAADWFGWPYGGTAIVMALVVADWLLGTARAAATHSLSGARFRHGIMKWIAWLGLFALTAGIRHSFPGYWPAEWFGNFVIFNVAVFEAISCARNAMSLSIAMNWRIPGLGFIVRRIEQLGNQRRRPESVVKIGSSPHVIRIEGDLDLGAATDMRDRALRVLEQYRRVAFDVEEVGLIDSSGLSLLVGIAAHAALLGIPMEDIEIIDPPPHVIRLLRMTKLEERFAMKVLPARGNTVSGLIRKVEMKAVNTSS